jgi:hypothetical protein
MRILVGTHCRLWLRVPNTPLSYRADVYSMEAFVELRKPHTPSLRASMYSMNDKKRDLFYGLREKIET